MGIIKKSRGVSERFARKVATYPIEGVVIKSAEARGVSRSAESMVKGRELSRQNAKRLS